MNAAKFERRARDIVTTLDAMIPELTPAEHRTIARGLAMLKAFWSDLPKEKSEAAKIALESVLDLAKLIGVAHVPMMGLGADAEAIIAETLPRLFGEATEIQRALAPVQRALAASAEGERGK